MSYKSFPNTPRPTLIMDLQWQERFPSIKCQQTRTVTFVWVYIFLLEAASSDKHFMYSFRFVPFTTASASCRAALRLRQPREATWSLTTQRLSLQNALGHMCSTVFSGFVFVCVMWASVSMKQRREQTISCTKHCQDRKKIFAFRCGKKGWTNLSWEFSQLCHDKMSKVRVLQASEFFFLCGQDVSVHKFEIASASLGSFNFISCL